MPSFAADVKSELARINEEEACCRLAELTALLHMGATVAISAEGKLGLKFDTDNAAVARRTLGLIKEMSQTLNTAVNMERTKRLRKKAIYSIFVPPSEAVKPVLKRLAIIEEEGLALRRDTWLPRKQCCRAAYLRGAFLGGGSVNRPEASYHLELVTGNHEDAKALHTLLKRLDFPVGLTDRKEHFVVYLKESESIIDFLHLIGATESAEQIEVARNIKEIRAQVNRIVNCETANMQKAATAAIKQIAAIRKLENRGRLKYLTEDLYHTAKMRLENPELSINDLAMLCYVSKSGMNNRLQRLIRLAEEEHI